MALSTKLRKRLDVALTNKTVSTELANTIDSHAPRTIADITYWVDQGVGVDANSGSQLAPFATINKALSLIPKTIGHSVAIKVKAGTYQEQLNLQFDFTGQGALNIQGQDFTAFTPATGVASGTFDAFATQTLLQTAVMTGAGWTINDLKGKFLKITSGPAVGRYLPIASNTATTVDLGGDVQNSGSSTTTLWPYVKSATFQIVQHAVVLQATSAMTSGCVVTVNNNAVIGSTSTQRLGQVLENIKVDITNLPLGSGVSSIVAGGGISIYGGATSCVLWGCSITGTSNKTGIAIDGLPQITFNDTYIGSGSGIAINSLGMKTISFNNVIIDTTSIGLRCLYGTTVFIGLGGILIQNASTGIVLQWAQLHAGVTNTTNQILVRNCGTGIDISRPPARISIGSGVVMNCTGPGIITWSSSASGHAMAIQLQNWKITGNGGGGILVGSGHCLLDLTGTTITGNTGWGVNVANRKEAGFNQVFTTTGTTMSGNTLGDFCLDGSTAVSIATLRADPDKDILDLVRVNRLLEL